ncbi:MAG: c-type cytochrome [Cryomorphaceae bacterium]|jgi:mono/diheme cytochrome c family protein|nr:c-type cytochrome [Cryomorphaceae bacterium]MBT3503382.1 c-type cytochrome [Cryomorphaceae bacterium]MBT3688886.1 c-type cytochrome [Cryomorphaceae bacterium]MBT4222618.1 c-type cytochrome [Cryomorphaceae bacterium]MBT4293690.1 c-type cytochrome [Cryomorphaceae bacterium]
MLQIKRIFLVTLLLPSLSISQDADVQAGKNLFNANCAVCHKLNKKAVGPALSGVTEKYDKDWLYSWIRNGSQMIKGGDAQAVAVWEEYNRSVMTNYPQFSDEQIDNILAYTNFTPPAPTNAAVGTTETTSQGSSVSINIILAVSIVIFTILVVMLFLVQRTLVKIANASGVKIESEPKKNITPLWQTVINNQFLIFIMVVGFLLSSAYFTYGYLMQIGIDQGYAPIQPIHYSHKIHAGANQIECKYCHSSARVSKHSGIPALNVCMNCHEYISDYNGEEDLENGYTKDFYTNEIKKLYYAVGWDEENQVYTGDTKPVKWVRIHNLPDFVYFNHAQHAQVANIECQTCHGPVEEMEVMYQYSPLTMGWCIDCHRESNVNKDNEYYQKIHDELSKKYGVEKLTVAQLGGIECAKCHY